MDWFKETLTENTRCVCPNAGEIVLYLSLQFCDFDGCPLLLLSTCRVRKSCLTMTTRHRLEELWKSHMEYIQLYTLVYTYFSHFSLLKLLHQTAKTTNPKPQNFQICAHKIQFQEHVQRIGSSRGPLGPCNGVHRRAAHDDLWMPDLINHHLRLRSLGFLCRCWENVAILPKGGYLVSLVLALHPYIKLVIGGPGIRSGLDKLSIMYIKTWSCRTLNLVPRSRNANQMPFWIVVGNELHAICIGTNLCTPCRARVNVDSDCIMHIIVT